MYSAAEEYFYLSSREVTYYMKKYLILIAAVFIQVCLGASYSWSTFIPALRNNYGFSITQTQIIFSAVTITTTLCMVIGGRLQDIIGPRIPVLFGGILLGSGYLLAGYSGGSYLFMFLFIGILSGIGIGLSYIAPIACAIKWFPHHKSLVTGIAVAGFGGSPIIISRLCEHLLNNQIDVLIIFKSLGLIFIVIVTSFAFFLEDPKNDKKLTGMVDVRMFSILKDKHFWVLLSGMFPCACIGLIIIGNMKPFGLSMNVDLLIAGTAIGLFGIFNAVGRVSWGWLGGLISYKKVILLSIVSTSAICFCAPLLAKSNVTFQLFALFAGFNHGAAMVLYAADVAQYYGSERVGSIYPVLLLSNVLTSLIGPPMAGKIFDTVGSYTPVFLIWGSISLICALFFNRFYETRVS